MSHQSTQDLLALLRHTAQAGAVTFDATAEGDLRRWERVGTVAAVLADTADLAARAQAELDKVSEALALAEAALPGLAAKEAELDAKNKAVARGPYTDAERAAARDKFDNARRNRQRAERDKRSAENDVTRLADQVKSARLHRARLQAEADSPPTFEHLRGLLEYIGVKVKTAA